MDLGDSDLALAVSKLIREWHPNSDTKLYLWNRLQSARFFGRYQHSLFGASPGGDRGGITCWPMGDIVEVLCAGHPTFGSFPPASFNLSEGRPEIEKQTQKVARAWSRAGWLSALTIRSQGEFLGLSLDTTDVRDETLIDDSVRPAHDARYIAEPIA